MLYLLDTAEFNQLNRPNVAVHVRLLQRVMPYHFKTDMCYSLEIIQGKNILSTPATRILHDFYLFSCGNDDLGYLKSYFNDTLILAVSCMHAFSMKSILAISIKIH